MNDVEFIIDRIVFDGLNIARSRTDSIRSFLQIELQQRLTQVSLRDELSSGDRSHITAQRVPINESYCDTDIATNLAENIIGALSGVGDK